MDINIHVSTGNQFTKYSDSSVTINEQEFTNNIIVSNNSISTTSLNNIKVISLNDIKPLIMQNPDIIIFGSGSAIVYPALDILQEINQHGIGYEVMTIQALCRTYNFLVSEGRKVVALLFFTN
ncbi:MAG: hypothetical protein RL017_942 [Pseudomonadota bacterium]|jgi:uncharacterized protein|nr:MTH938/NDUFAF3 family protein [Burkholderiales bacterium]